MTRFYSGKDGALYHGPEDTTGIITPTRKAGRVTQWTFETVMEQLVTTALGDTENTFQPGLRTHSGSARIMYYVDETGENTASLLLNTLLKPRTIIDQPRVAATPELWRIQLRIDENISTFKRIQGPVRIRRASMAMAVGEICAVDIDFAFIGAPITVTI